MTLSILQTFVAGCAGSVAIEVLTVIKVYTKEPIAFPERYGQLFFWVARMLLAFIGGGLAVAYDINTMLLAANIGASAPLLLTALAQGIQNPRNQIAGRASKERTGP